MSSLDPPRRRRAIVSRLLLVPAALAFGCASVVSRENTGRFALREVWEPSGPEVVLRVASVAYEGERVVLTGDVTERTALQRRIEVSPIVIERYYSYSVLRDLKWKLYLVGSVLRVPYKVVTGFLGPSRRTGYRRWGMENLAYNFSTALGTFVPGLLPEPADHLPGFGFSEDPATRRARAQWRVEHESELVKTVPFSFASATLQLSRAYPLALDRLGRFELRVRVKEWESRSATLDLSIDESPYRAILEIAQDP